MKKTTFTDTMIKKLKPLDDDYSRSEGNGFTIRVMPSGVKTWLYQYQLDGKRRKMSLGSYPDITMETARSHFEDAKKKVKNGIDPVAEKEQAEEDRIKAPTVADLINRYIKEHAMPKKRGWMEDKRILEKDALPTWGKRKAADISKSDVKSLLKKIVERGAPGSANGNFKCIRKMFNYAVEEEILAISPCISVKMPAPLNTRERTLSETEIRTLWNNLETANVSDEIKRALKLIFVTAQRPGEVIGMHTSEIDESGRWWTIPSERSKNGRSHHVYLTDTALELIGDMKAVDPKTGKNVIDEKTGKDVDKGFIFPCPHEKKKQPIAVSALAHAVRRNLAWPIFHKGKPVFGADGKAVTENRLGVEAFTPHDGRRTAATFISQIGFMDEIIDALLNHVKQGIIKTYNQNKYDAEKQAALEAWENKIKIILAGEKVVDLTAERQKRKAA